MSDYVPLPYERTTEPRWRCMITGNLEYAKPHDGGAQASRRRLARNCLCRETHKHVYRAGFTVRFGDYTGFQVTPNPESS